MMLAALGLSPFALAPLAPWAVHWSRRRSGWLLALLPLALTAYFATQAPGIAGGGTATASFEWMPALDVRFSLYLDGLSLLFTILICGIGTIIVVYAGTYLGGHADLGRFQAFILLFTGSMLGLVLADNVVTLFVFWELTTITSYLLIGFDHEREDARSAALQALLVTGGGGLALLAGLLLLGTAGGAYELSELTGRGDLVRQHELYLPALSLILLGAFAKSAQAPFHFWLPNAMEAPTPVSAYLHSATMVKAGIYLLARLAPVLGNTDAWLYTVTTTGAATLLIGGCLALIENDLKRVLACSTIAVLGMLTMLIGLGSTLAIKAAMAVVLGHALYKGALFLVAGAVDHATGTRDVRRLGGLATKMPVTAVAAGLAALSMAGIPPLFGFIAKEELLEASLHAPLEATTMTLVALAGSGLTVAAAILVGARPFFGRVSSAAEAAHEASPSLWLGPALLAAGSLLLGLAPLLVDANLVSPAVAATLGEPAPVELSLWDGFTPALGFSVLALAGGAALYIGLASYRRAAVSLAGMAGWSPGNWYKRSVAGLDLLARGQTRVLQSGYLRVYVLVIMVVTVVIAGATLIDRGGLRAPGRPDGARFYEVALILIVLAGALMAATTSSRLTAVAALGVVGYGIAMVYLLFGAPDLAMAQVLVETLTVILLVFAFYQLPRFARLSSVRLRLRDAVAAGAAGALMTALVLVVTAVDQHSNVSEFYARSSAPLAHGRNVVNAVLVDFRALDTLGEITVLALAAVGVYALLKLRPAKGGGE